MPDIKVGSIVWDEAYGEGIVVGFDRPEYAEVRFGDREVWVHAGGLEVEQTEPTAGSTYQTVWEAITSIETSWNELLETLKEFRRAELDSNGNKESASSECLKYIIETHFGAEHAQ